MALCVALSACSGWQPFDRPYNRENPKGAPNPKGPGLFSGKDGEFVIYKKD
jgi:hypothetical protein